MPQFRGRKSAFGAPGTEPHWSPAIKEGIGSACALGSPIWFTISNGILTEIYYPNVDRPQIRDVQFLFTDGDQLFLEEKRDLEHEVERIAPAQGYRITCRDKEDRFAYVKEVITDPRRACILMQVSLKGKDEFLKRLQVHVLCAPHLDGSGEANNAFVVEVSGRELLVAGKNGHWMVAGASRAFAKLSCGYVGRSDGYTDLSAHKRMTFEFDEAKNGNVALTGQLDLRGERQFTVAIAFGENLSNATACFLQSMGGDYQEQRRVFIRQWEDTVHGRKPIEKASGDNGRLYHSSYNIVLAHEDKLYQGAFVASLTIPWGEARNDKKGRGGYHLVWTRDMVQSALGLLAAGNTDAPCRALIYLAARQEENGSFPQNFWVDGEPFRNGMQLDEVAFPVILAWRLQRENLLSHFNPGVMVRRAVNFLLMSGPVTGEERWEEASGYSPSTLATIIAACICAAAFERDRGKPETASFLESYADFLLAHLEEWTVTPEGYFVRLNPARQGQVAASGDVGKANLRLTSQPPESSDSFPARDVVDAGFLQLVRYGIFAPDDPVIVKSLQEVDRTLKVETPFGSCWRRYNHDGYGQRSDGSPYEIWGKGRPWPLLTGERAHYELAAGGDYKPLVHALEAFAGKTCLLPEQIWDEADLPESHLRRGGRTGSAVPLVWAHSEYLRLLRSCHDNQVFDLIPEVAKRYREQKQESKVEFWLPKHPIAQARKGCILRVCAPRAFRLRWSQDGWATWQDGESSASGAGAEFFDLAESAVAAGVEFTFFWKTRNTWEGRNHRVEMRR